MAFLFGGMALDWVRRELRSGSALLPLEPQVFDLLEFLVRNRDHVVTRDDLLAAVWNGRIVSDSAIDARINAARRAIGDDGEQQRWIRTFARKGFRFVGDVREEPGSTILTDRSSAMQIKPTVAILPFANMSGDPEQEYFSDGITEDIITDLSKVSALHVTSRNTAFTFKGRPVDIAQVALRLKVGHIVEGSVRKAGGRVRITAQLIDASKDNHVWGERYDRDLNDIFALQDEIAQAIVAALKVKLLPGEKKAIENRSTRDPEAYQTYLQSRYHFLRHGMKSLEIAIRFGRRALEIDPQYARAWALIAVCQSALRIRGRSDESGLAAAEAALSLDPTLAEAHSARGRVLGDLGRYAEAVVELKESMRLDPDSPDARFDFGRFCCVFGRYEEAIEHLERAAALSEERYVSLCFAAQAYRTLGCDGEARGAARRALERIEREIAMRPDNALALSFGVCMLVQLGDKERANEWISRALIVEPDDPITHYNLACSLAQMGETDRALDLLETARKTSNFAVVPRIENDSDLAPLHGHPRYQALIADGKARLAASRKSNAD